ncbi:tetratricopeptide repeat protein [Kibdelosporangium phytohabitans]|uniref:Tetratricopeptide repeat protein n=1 Tax=Kibdelosporangium phytohabitans TaxID=860235 RepID=A0A0N9I7J4_9PSEU|nr:tetratricopeptide repeat protein [Kibdelosporangium phytohabitans]ALG10598.1 hypothetical protein AOZ06_30185 [Kibdelosporangium phytohabitans]MBE1461710.1 tetratricopeptide (TPR) repeat protein [Kibdelosporangium phytohabitans]
MHASLSRRFTASLIAATIGAGGVLAGLPVSAAPAAADPAPIPVTADYDGDGKPDKAEWRPADGTWVITPASGGPVITQQFGQAGDLPVPGDYQGDAKIELGVVRAGGVLRARAVTGGAVQEHPWATAAYRPVDGDVPRVLNLAKAASELANRLHSGHRFGEATEASKVARDLYRKVAEHEPSHLAGWGTAALALGSNLSLTGQHQEGIIATYEGVEVFHQLGDQARLAAAYEALAGVFHRAFRFNEAVTPSRKAHDIYERLGLKVDQIRAAFALGGNLSLSGRHKEAILYGKRAVEVATAINDQQKLAEAYFQLADRYHYASQFADAAKASEESVKLYRALVVTKPGLRGDLGRALIQWGGNLALSGDRAKAVEVTKEAVEVYGQAGDRVGQAGAYDALVQRLLEAGRAAEAVDPAQRARQIYGDLLTVNRAQFLPGWSNAALVLGQTLASLGRGAEAKPHAQEAVDGFKEVVRDNPTVELYRARLKAAEDLLARL